MQTHEFVQWCETMFYGTGAVICLFLTAYAIIFLGIGLFTGDPIESGDEVPEAPESTITISGDKPRQIVAYRQNGSVIVTESPKFPRRNG